MLAYKRFPIYNQRYHLTHITCIRGSSRYQAYMKQYYDLVKEELNLDWEKLDCFPQSPSLCFWGLLKDRSLSSSTTLGRPPGAGKGAAMGGFSGVTGGGLSLDGRACLARCWRWRVTWWAVRWLPWYDVSVLKKEHMQPMIDSLFLKKSNKALSGSTSNLLILEPPQRVRHVFQILSPIPTDVAGTRR